MATSSTEFGSALIALLSLGSGAVADPLPFIALMGLGFVIGIGGHLYRSPAAIATGIGMIFVATLVPLGLYLSDR